MGPHGPQRRVARPANVADWHVSDVSPWSSSIRPQVIDNGSPLEVLLLVRACELPGDAAALWFVRVVERGGHVVVRVVTRRDGPLAGDRQAVLDAFSPVGISGEGMASPANVVALDIGPQAPIACVKGLLERGEADGRWHYEEGCVTDEWLRLS